MKKCVKCGGPSAVTDTRKTNSETVSMQRIQCRSCGFVNRVFEYQVITRLDYNYRLRHLTIGDLVCFKTKKSDQTVYRVEFIKDYNVLLSYGKDLFKMVNINDIMRTKKPLTT